MDLEWKIKKQQNLHPPRKRGSICIKELPCHYRNNGNMKIVDLQRMQQKQQRWSGGGKWVAISEKPTILLLAVVKVTRNYRIIIREQRVRQWWRMEEVL